MNDLRLIQWDITSRDCDLCANVEREGWWGESGVTHCRLCHRTWKMTTKQAHCMTCCEHFSSPSAFDLHLLPLDAGEACADPSTFTNKKTKERLLVQREDGTWTRPDPRHKDYYPERVDIWAEGVEWEEETED